MRHTPDDNEPFDPRDLGPDPDTVDLDDVDLDDLQVPPPDAPPVPHHCGGCGMRMRASPAFRAICATCDRRLGRVATWRSPGGGRAPRAVWIDYACPGCLAVVAGEARFAAWCEVCCVRFARLPR